MLELSWLLMPSKLATGAGRLGVGATVWTAASGFSDSARSARRRACELPGMVRLRIARFSAASASSSSSVRSVCVGDAATSRNAGDSAKFTARAVTGPGPSSWAWATDEQPELDDKPPSIAPTTPPTSHREPVFKDPPRCRNFSCDPRRTWRGTERGRLCFRDRQCQAPSERHHGAYPREWPTLRGTQDERPAPLRIHGNLVVGQRAARLRRGRRSRSQMELRRLLHPPLLPDGLVLLARGRGPGRRWPAGRRLGSLRRRLPERGHPGSQVARHEPPEGVAR